MDNLLGHNSGLYHIPNLVWIGDNKLANGDKRPFDGSVLRVSVSVAAAAIEQCLKILRRHGAVVEEALSVAGAHVA